MIAICDNFCSPAAATGRRTFQGPFTNTARTPTVSTVCRENTVIYGIFGFLDSCGQFRILYGIPEVREVSKNLPGARGFVFPKYRPIPSHGDPIHPQNSLNLMSQITYVVQLSVKLSLIFLFWACTLGGLELSKKMRIEFQTGVRGGYGASTPHILVIIGGSTPHILGKVL